MKLNLEHWDATVTLFMKSGVGQYFGPSKHLKETWPWDSWFIGVIQKRTRLFLPGDVVLGHYSNGQGERWQCWGRSSRGYYVGGYNGTYVDFFRYKSSDDYKHSWKGNDRTTGYILSFDELKDLERLDGENVGASRRRMLFTLHDPVIRDLLDSHARELAACRVGAGSPATYFHKER